MAGIDNRRPDDWATYFWAGDREEPEVGGQVDRSVSAERPGVHQPPPSGRPDNAVDHDPQRNSPQRDSAQQINLQGDKPQRDHPQRDDPQHPDRLSQAGGEPADEHGLDETGEKRRRGVTSRRTLTFIGLAFALNVVAVSALVLTNDGDEQDTLGVEVRNSDDFADEDSLSIQIPLNPNSDTPPLEDNGVPVDSSLIPLQMVITDGKLKLRGTASSDEQAELMINEARAVFAEAELVKEYEVNPAAPTPSRGVVVQKPVVFEPGSDVIREEFYTILDACADVMKQNPTLVMNVSGHTDADGSAAYNLVLAEARAQAVIDYYASKGLDRAKFANTAVGEDAPIASNATEQGKETNRRTDLKFEGIFDDVVQESGS